MFKNKIISFFLALLMMVQMVPVEQIGAMLCSNQWTEELPHNAEQSSKSDSSVCHFIPPDQHLFVSMFCDATALIFLHNCDKIPVNHAADVVSPPPDVC